MIRVVDCGSQLTQLIARNIREDKVFSDIVPFKTQPRNIRKRGLEGLVVSGGQFSVYDEKAPKPSKKILGFNVPVIGICYGQQWIGHVLGGKVEPTGSREYGKTKIRITKKSPLFKGIPGGEFDVWMSHADVVKEVPKGFEVVAVSENGHVAAMQNKDRKIYAVQFHPEVTHTQHGKRMLYNFARICNAKKTWKPENLVDNAVEQIRGTVKGGIAISGVSGGVDSVTLALIMHKALGDRHYGIFVDNGLLRKDEGIEVAATLAGMNINFLHVNAQERNLRKLRGVTDPDRKREIIGNEFIYVFQEHAKNLQAEYLGQGTLYPDVIESVPIYGVSSVIKRHHNVGGLPDAMELGLIEPFRDIFKDEVRVVAESLEMPRDVVWRHPFPGPGLAVRVIGEITPQKLAILREADAIYMEELKKKGIYYDIAQAFAVLTSDRTVGVMGDEGTYDYVVALRAVTTSNFMTSDIYRFEWGVLQAITNRIINEVKGVSRVVYDTSQKPPSTIEWE